ncbi:STAS domain-containing protein [Sorangium sp. So ce394]|uniref:STAS domain-containing protein n=1 Tax=Sorangium sp. So ce394 TaxID=3133310 RepID=UPI003F5C7B62
MNTSDQLTQLRRRIEELERSEARYRGIFESSPISLWEEDWSAVRRHIDRILASGVTDLDTHLRAHVDDVFTGIALVKILDVNKATLELCRASSKEQILAGLSVIFDEPAVMTFHRELVALGSGATSFEEETFISTLDGERRTVTLRLAMSAGSEQTWERCFVSLLDITDRKRAEEALRQSKEETIRAQMTMLAQLSTPVIPISDDVIVMPLIGALDRARMQQATGALLDELQRRAARVAILDITGVPGMDAEATYGILQAASAVRLLGAKVVLTGIRPEVARCLVDLGSDLPDIVTRGTLQAGIAYAMQGGAGQR